jgi:murein DD-endopeptidase MepM/ murein hydrolase activator NlpD
MRHDSPARNDGRGRAAKLTVPPGRGRAIFFGMTMRALRTHHAIASIFALAILAVPIHTADDRPGTGLTTAIAPQAPPARPAGSPRPETRRLKPRETLEMALRRGGVAPADAAQISRALRGKVDLRRLAPGEELTFERGAEGDLLRIVYRRSPVEWYEVRPEALAARGRPDAPAARGWTAHAHRVPVESRVDVIAGRLEDSLFASIERLGEQPALTAKLVTLLEWDFDFAADALPGDQFRMAVEKRFARGAFVGYGDILAAEYRSADRPALSAVRFPDRDGAPRYYDFQGRAIRKMFLRAPLEFTRVTSGYSHARRHPVLGGLRPHLAVDYGAPTGTPVRAVADGVVTASGRAGGFGLSVTIRHARGYETMYNHLSKTLVRAGTRVRQRQLIGRVGSTGLSTGPHLDYRLRKNGRWVNPLSEKFIPGEPVPGARMRAFQAHVKALRTQIALAPTVGAPAR